MARNCFKIPFQRYQNYLLGCQRSRDMTCRRNWVVGIRSNFDDLYFNDHLNEKKKNVAIFFSWNTTTAKILSRCESVMSGTLDDLTRNDPNAMSCMWHGMTLMICHVCDIQLRMSHSGEEANPREPTPTLWIQSRCCTFFRQRRLEQSRRLASTTPHRPILGGSPGPD